MKAKLTIAVLVVLAVLALLAAGCGKKPTAPPGGPAMTTPPPGAPTGGQVEAGAPEKTEAEEAGQPEATEPEAGQPEGGETAAPEEKSEEQSSSDKPAKAKLSDDEFVEMMGDLAVAIKKIGDEQLPPEKAEAELSKVAKKYGLTLDEIKKEQEAHQVGTKEQQQALGMRVLKRMEERLQEAEKKSGK